MQFSVAQIRPAGCLAAVLLLSLASSQTHAAAIADSEFGALQQQITRPGQTVHVAVLLTRLNLGDMAGGDPAKAADTRVRESRLYAELGAQALPQGRWNNGLGIIGMNVTAAGLNALRASGQALEFRGSVHPSVRAHRIGPDFMDLERALEASGRVSAAIRIRNEQATLSMGTNGCAQVRGGMAAVNEFATRAGRVLDGLHANDVPNLAEARAALAAATSRAQLDSTEVVLNINHRAWVMLATHADVASLRLAQSAPVPDTLLDPSVLAAARQDGQTEVLLLLRLPFRQASRSAREFKAMTDAYDDALSALRVRLGLTSALRAMPEFGLAGGVLKLSEVESLFGRRDARVMAVVANRPAAAPLLDTSIARTRVPLVWNHDAAAYPESLYPDAGFRGAFPSVQGNPASPHVPIKIVVVDTGVFKAHPMT